MVNTNYNYNESNDALSLKNPQVTALHTQPTQKTPHVAILLCTYQGQRYLSEQLESFATQTHSNWKVWASDDKSKDETPAILEHYQKQWGTERLSILLGPAQGFVANFWSLTCDANILADYFAYSDQDDVWEPERLSRALAWLTRIPADVPALYCSRTRYISKNGEELGTSALFEKPPHFRNALVQSIAGGNTMVFNQAARKLLIQTPSHKNVMSHDWWAYILVTGCGGLVFYDAYPGVLYRQHGSNVVGQNITLAAQWQRVKTLLAGDFKHWNEVNITTLDKMSHCLTEESRKIVTFFNKARRGFILSRIANLYRSGVYRQTTSGNIALYIATLLRKI